MLAQHPRDQAAGGSSQSFFLVLFENLRVCPLPHRTHSPTPTQDMTTPHTHTSCELPTEHRDCAHEHMKKYTLYIIHQGPYSCSHTHNLATSRPCRKGRGCRTSGKDRRGKRTTKEGKRAH